MCGDFAALLKRYRVTRATADRFAGDFPAEQMRGHGIKVEPADRAKSDLYKAFLPMLNSDQVELLDLPRLRTQLASLERRVGRSGRDSIDHPANGNDDVVNSAAGALVLAGARDRMPQGLLFVGPPSESEIAELDAELVHLKKELGLA